MDFGQISRSEHLPARIAAKIGREITEGRIAPGEKLPTEHLLATTFGVSRSVVREAIAQLRNEGLVETRQGVSAFATEIERRQSLRIEQGDLANRGSFRDLFQLRIPLEVEAARLAAIHHTPQDLGKIDEALQQMTGAEKWTEQGIVADLAFHRAIAAATHNEYFLLFIGFIAERISLAINAATRRCNTGGDRRSHDCGTCLHPKWRGGARSGQGRGGDAPSSERGGGPPDLTIESFSS